MDIFSWKILFEIKNLENINAVSKLILCEFSENGYANEVRLFHILPPKETLQLVFNIQYSLGPKV